MPKNHAMIRTLLGLRGNPRACVYTEPLWGIPYNLFIPYASLYMLALGYRPRKSAWWPASAWQPRSCSLF